MVPLTYLVHADGPPVARLTHPRVDDMLWTRYRVDLLDGPVDWTSRRWTVRGDGEEHRDVSIRDGGDGTVLIRTSAADGPTGRDRRGPLRRGPRRWLRWVVARAVDAVDRAFRGA